MFELIVWGSPYTSLGQFAVWISLSCLDFINNMENCDLQRRLEFPVVDWKKLASMVSYDLLD